MDALAHRLRESAASDEGEELPLEPRVPTGAVEGPIQDPDPGAAPMAEVCQSPPQEGL